MCSLRYCLGVQRTRGKLLNTLVELLVSHTATRSLMFGQREGSLSEQEGKERAEVSRFEELRVFECTMREFLLEGFPYLLFTILASFSCRISYFTPVSVTLQPIADFECFYYLFYEIKLPLKGFLQQSTFTRLCRKMIQYEDPLFII